MKRISICVVKLSYSSYTWLFTVYRQIEFIIIIGPCGQNVCCAVDFTNNCLWNGVGFAQSRGGFAQFEHSKGSKITMCKAVALVWWLWLLFKIALLMSIFILLFLVQFFKGIQGIKCVALHMFYFVFFSKQPYWIVFSLSIDAKQIIPN